MLQNGKESEICDHTRIIHFCPDISKNRLRSCFCVHRLWHFLLPTFSKQHYYISHIKMRPQRLRRRTDVKPRSLKRMTSPACRIVLYCCTGEWERTSPERSRGGWDCLQGKFSISDLKLTATWHVEKNKQYEYSRLRTSFEVIWL